MPIITRYIHPPIPIRYYDWIAYNNPEFGPWGFGKTESAAIHDLLRFEENRI